MSKTNSYLTIGIAAGIFTATLVGLSIASYIKSKRGIKRISVSDGTETNRPRYAKEYQKENINALFQELILYHDGIYEQVLSLDMLSESMKELLNRLINRITLSFHVIMPYLRTDKADFHIQNESDYAIGLAHGMILSGFTSEFKDHNKREPNQEEMIEVSKILFERNEELRKSILKSE